MRIPMIASLMVLLAGCGAAPQAALVTAPVKLRAAAAPAQAPAAIPATSTGYRAAEAPASAAPGVPFDVLTLNTWGKPGILGTDLKRRFKLIGQSVQGHDVVGLQETFTSIAADLEQSAGYPTFLRPKNGKLFQVNSGLTVMADHPQLETDFAAFKQAAAGDMFARKGVLFVRIDGPGVGPVDVYNTHFQAEVGAKYDAIRMHDATVLVEHVKRHEAGNPTIVMGDFNAHDDSEAYAFMVEQLHLRDAFTEAQPDAPGYTAGPQNPYRKKGSKGKRIDYVLATGGTRFDMRVDAADVVLDEPVEGVVLSDHYGLNAKLTFLPKP